MRKTLILVLNCCLLQAAPAVEPRVVRLLGQMVELTTDRGERAYGRLIWFNREFVTLQQGGRCEQISLAAIDEIRREEARTSAEEKVGLVLGGLAMMSVLAPVYIIGKVVDPLRPVLLAGRWESVNPIRPGVHARLDFGSDQTAVQSTEVLTRGRYATASDTVRLEFGGRTVEAPYAFHCGALVLRSEEFKRQSIPSIHAPAIAGSWCREGERAEVCFEFDSGGAFVKRTRLDSKSGTYRRLRSVLELKWASGAERSRLRFDKGELELGSRGRTTRYRRLV